jgi:hypothetical protein
MAISQEYSILSRLDISPGDHSSRSFSNTYLRSDSRCAILLFPSLLDEAAVFALWLAEKARYPLFPLFRIISRLMVLADRLISSAIARMVFFCASPLLMLSRSCIASLL